MKSIKNITTLLVLPIILMSFTKCSSQKNLQEKAPTNFGNVYFQKWVAGVKGGGSGINLFIPTDETSLRNVKLDSVYFRGKAAKLETKANNNTLFIGRFSTAFNQQKDMVMSGDSKEEYGNEAPIINAKLPFELKENECVVSYLEGDTIKYFKIENITEQQAVHYPQTRTDKQ